MAELTGGLIEMNAHMVRQERFDFIIALGIVVAVIFVMLAAFSWKESKRLSAAWMLFAAVGFAVAVIAINQPRIKEIKVCADGPVSIEQISTVYDIVEVDGKMLTLRER